MRVTGKGRAIGSALLITGLASLSSCGGGSGGGGSGEGGSGGGENPEAAATDSPVNTDLALAGSLKLVGTGSSVGLTSPFFSLASDDAYNIYCVTFEDDPIACKAEVDSSGEFNATCEDYSGKAFGCFLRKGNKTVADIVFDQGDEQGGDSQLVVGAGVLQVKLNYDPDLGVATAVVDADASSALAAQNIAEIKALKGAQDTSLPNMTGTYAIACLGVEDESGAKVPCLTGENDDGAPDSIYLNEWEKDGRRRVSIWTSEAAKTACLGSSNNELKPDFRIQIGSNEPVRFDISNLKSFRTGYETVISQFASAHPDAFANLLDATGTDWEVQECQNQEANEAQAQTAFSEETCLIVAPLVEPFTWWNPVQNREETRWEAQWIGTWREALDANAARSFDESKITAVEKQCWNYLVSEPRADMPPCPPHLVEPYNGAQATEAILTFTDYDYVEGDQRGPVEFVCKDPISEKSGDDAPLIRQPLVAKGDAASYKAAALANITSNNSGHYGDPGCSKVALSELFPGLTGSLATREVYKNQRRVIMRTFGELLRSEKDDGHDVCQDYTSKNTSELSAFNFKTSCLEGGGPLCWEGRRMLEDLAIEIADSGANFEAKSQDPYEWSGPGIAALCAAAGGLTQPELDVLDSFAPPPSQNNNSDQSFENWKQEKIDAKITCRAAFLALPSWGAKMNALQTAILSPERMPPSVALQCGGDEASRAAIAALTQSSCMPELELDTRCDQGSCKEVLRCWGTEDGKCIDSEGNFAGGIPGRYENTALKLRFGGAFEMSSLTVETWNQWTASGNQVCKAARSFKLAGTKVTDTQFDGRLTFGDNQVCEGADDSSENHNGDFGTEGMGAGPGMQLDGAAGAPPPPGEGGDNTRADRRDPPMYLRFTKQ